MFGTQREIGPLTSLRYLAASLVFMEHIVMIPGMEWMDMGGGCLGKAGVCIFFVLSGFILTYAHGGEDWKGAFGKNAGAFYWSRFARIYPLHWLMFLVALPLGLNSNTARASLSDFPFLLTLTERVLPTAVVSSQPVKVAWTLAVEFLFYVSAPLFFLALCRRKNPLAILSVIIPAYIVGIVLLMMAHPGWNLGGYCRIPEFLLGMAGFHFLKQTDISRNAVALLLLGAAMMTAACVCDHYWGLTYYYFAYAPGALLLILGAGSLRGSLQAFLSKPFLLLLGNASFALYLLHDPFLRYSKVFFNRSGIVFSPVASVFVSLLFFVLITAGSIVCYRFYENPIRLRLRSWMKSRKG